MDKIKLGISACLLGKPVRYDGRHKLDPFLQDAFSAQVDYVPVCPEVEMGLGVPREPMRLEGDPARPKMITIKTRIDHTARMHAWARARIKALEAENLCGFIFKSRSPSCGIGTVNVFDAAGLAANIGSGLFAAAFKRRLPLVPIAEESALADPALREDFIQRIDVLRHWRAMLANGKSLDALTAFHTAHRGVLRSHRHLLDELVATGQTEPAQDLVAQYEILLLQALA
ncbi:MAG: DUF523 domain-containing protein [Kiritimatiellia bacterium]|jgi:uncharacterized protein YbbK (DUF523 family)